MSYQITISFKNSYIHVVHIGDDSYDISSELLTHMAEACEHYNCYKLLVESNNNSSVSTIDSHRHIEIINKAGFTGKHKIAWINHNQEIQESYEYTLTVLKNRILINAEFFSNIDEAEKWLLNQ